MRIAITTPTFAPENSGLGNVVMQYALALQALGHEVDVLTASSKAPDIRQHDIGFPFKIKRFDCKGSFALHNFVRGAVREYLRYLKANRYDVIIAHAAQNWASELALIFGQANLKVYHSHCVSSGEILNYGFRDIIRFSCWLPYRILQRKILSRAHGSVFLGVREDGARCCDKRMLSHLPYIVLPNPPSYALANLAGKKIRKNRTGRTISLLSVGSMDYLKGHDRVLTALSKVRTPHDIVLRIFSQQNTKFREKIRRLERHLPDNIKVEVVTGVSGSELYKEYLNADLFLYGSRTECYPLVLADCQPAGLEFIAFDTGYIREITGGITVSSTDEMARKIEQWIRSGVRLSAELKNNGATECITWNKNAYLLDSFIGKLLVDRLPQDQTSPS